MHLGAQSGVSEVQHTLMQLLLFLVVVGRCWLAIVVIGVVVGVVVFAVVFNVVVVVGVVAFAVVVVVCCCLLLLLASSFHSGCC